MQTKRIDFPIHKRFDGIPTNGYLINSSPLGKSKTPLGQLGVLKETIKPIVQKSFVKDDGYKMSFTTLKLVMETIDPAFKEVNLLDLGRSMFQLQNKIGFKVKHNSTFIDTFTNRKVNMKPVIIGIKPNCGYIQPTFNWDQSKGT